MEKVGGATVENGATKWANFEPSSIAENIVPTVRK